MNLVIVGIALVCVGLSGIAFRLVALRLAEDGRYDWCQTDKMSWMDNDRWFVLEGAAILFGVCLLAVGII